MKRIYFGIAIVAIIFWGACTKTSSPIIYTGKTVDMILNEAYGANERNTMDIYLPANRNNNTAFVLLLHGGGWINGDKKDMLAFQQQLLARGIASASMNYRYASATIHYKDMMQDIHDAISFCKTNAGLWKMNNSHFTICGASAGGHLALLYSYAYNSNNTVSAVISLSGPTNISDTQWLDDFGALGMQITYEALTGAPYIKGKPLDLRYADASPISHIANIPTMMVHGSNDKIVAHRQVEMLDAALTSKTVEHVLYTIAGAGHDLGFNNNDTFLTVIGNIENWVKTYGINNNLSLSPQKI